MEEKKLQIDAAALARETLNGRQPGEDLDEALLRSCKKLHGESGMFAFQGMQAALSALAERAGVGREAALQQIAGGQSGPSPLRISTTIRATRTVAAMSPGDLPPERHAEVEQAIAEGKGRVVVDNKAAGAGRQPAAVRRCGYCGGEFTSEISACPICGRAAKASFWAKLFGK